MCFFVDAAHFVMQPFLGFLWCFVRQFIQSPSGRKRFNVLGALHATSQQIVTVTNDTYINAYSVAKLLCKLAVDFRDLPITLVMDNARYQRCRFIMDLSTALGIELLFLPPYSPNLNLIERFWKYVKKTCLYSEYYDTFPDFVQAISDTISNPCRKTLSSLLTLNFQTLNSATL
jgi:transposase